MQIEAKIPVFESFSSAFSGISSKMGLSEFHGVLVGLACKDYLFNGLLSFDTLLRLLESRANLKSQQRQFILDFYAGICQEMETKREDFSPLIPNPESPLLERSTALSDWCEGFVFGLEWGSSVHEKLSEESHNAMDCMFGISDLDFSQVEFKDEYKELDECSFDFAFKFVKDSVLGIYEEVAGKVKQLH